MHGHTWEDPERYKTWTVNQANQNDWPKETQKKWNSNFNEGTTQEVSLQISPWAYPHMLYSFPLNKYFTCFITFQFWGILFCKAKGPGSLSLTTGLVARIWCSHYRDSACLWLGTQAMLQATADRGHPRSYPLLPYFWGSSLGAGAKGLSVYLGILPNFKHNLKNIRLFWGYNWLDGIKQAAWLLMTKVASRLQIEHKKGNSWR